MPKKKAARIPVRDGVPGCFDGKGDFDGWRSAARASPPGLDGYCADCLPVFKARMRALGRCTHAAVKFMEDRDGGVFGHRPLAERREERLKEKEGSQCQMERRLRHPRVTGQRR